MVGSSLSRVFVGLVRRTWLVAVTTVIVCAAFAAHAVAALVEARHLDALPPSAPHHHGRQIVETEHRSPEPVPDGAPLVARNMFCSTCTPEPVANGDGPGSTNAFSPAAELIATSIGREPTATLRVPTTQIQGDFGLGDTLPGIGTITRIGFSTVDLRDADGRTGTLSLRAALSPTAAEPPPSSPVAATTGEADASVRKIDDTTYEAERSLVRELMTSNGQNAGARILPINKGGKLDGLRLVGVRPGKLAAQLGLANGDVLQAINNTKIEDANTLLDLYAQLDKLDTVTFEGTRRGKPLSLTIRLR